MRILVKMTWVVMTVLCIERLEAMAHAEDTEPVRKQKSLRGDQVPHGVRYDKCNHWPLQCEKPQRCKLDGCSRRTRFLCTKCQVYLCTTGTNCFLTYHGITVF